MVTNVVACAVCMFVRPSFCSGCLWHSGEIADTRVGMCTNILPYLKSDAGHCLLQNMSFSGVAD